MRNKLIITGGIILILFVLFYLPFWELFDLQKESYLPSIENNNIMQLLDTGIVGLLSSLGVIFIFYSDARSTKLGKALFITPVLFFPIWFIFEFIFPESSVVPEVILFVCILLFLIPVLVKKQIEYKVSIL